MASNDKSRKSYNAAFKLKVISVAEEKGKHQAAKLFNVHRKRVQEWCKAKEHLKTAKKSEKRKSGAGRPVRYADIEEKLISWFQEHRSAGVRVTGKSLKQEALRLHRLNGSQSFKASQGWFAKFKKRHDISFRRTTHVSQHSAAITDDKIDKFLHYIIRLRRLRQYEDRDILNMDETPVWLEMPGKSTLNARGAKEVSVSSTGHEKQRITVTLGAYADGTKLAPLVHFPGLRPLPRNDVPSGIITYMCGAGKKSWADETSIKFWLSKLYGVNNQRRRLLVWDAFRGHLTPSIKTSVKTTYNTDMAVIPGGCTSKLQPADVSWNRPFKAKLSELYDEWLFSGTVEETRFGNRKAPPKPLLLRWVKEAWASITPEIIVKSFKKCGITSALDGSEDHLFNVESDDDSDSQFDGFSPDDVAMAEQILEVVHETMDTNGTDSVTDRTQLTGAVLSDEDGVDSDHGDVSTDYDSPGH